MALIHHDHRQRGSWWWWWRRRGRLLPNARNPVTISVVIIIIIIAAALAPITDATRLSAKWSMLPSNTPQHLMFPFGGGRIGGAKAVEEAHNIDPTTYFAGDVRWPGAVRIDPNAKTKEQQDLESHLMRFTQTAHEFHRKRKIILDPIALRAMKPKRKVNAIDNWYDAEPTMHKQVLVNDLARFVDATDWAASCASMSDGTEPTICHGPVKPLEPGEEETPPEPKPGPKDGWGVKYINPTWVLPVNHNAPDSAKFFDPATNKNPLHVGEGEGGEAAPVPAPTEPPAPPADAAEEEAEREVAKAEVKEEAKVELKEEMRAEVKKELKEELKKDGTIEEGEGAKPGAKAAAAKPKPKVTDDEMPPDPDAAAAAKGKAEATPVKPGAKPEAAKPKAPAKPPAAAAKKEGEDKPPPDPDAEKDKVELRDAAVPPEEVPPREKASGPKPPHYSHFSGKVPNFPVPDKHPGLPVKPPSSVNVGPLTYSQNL